MAPHRRNIISSHTRGVGKSWKLLRHNMPSFQEILGSETDAFSSNRRNDQLNVASKLLLNYLSKNQGSVQRRPSGSIQLQQHMQLHHDIPPLASTISKLTSILGHNDEAQLSISQISNQQTGMGWHEFLRFWLLFVVFISSSWERRGMHDNLSINLYCTHPKAQMVWKIIHHEKRQKFLTDVFKLFRLIWFVLFRLNNDKGDESFKFADTLPPDERAWKTKPKCRLFFWEILFEVNSAFGKVSNLINMIPRVNQR